MFLIHTSLKESVGKERIVFLCGSSVETLCLCGEFFFGPNFTTDTEDHRGGTEGFVFPTDLFSEAISASQKNRIG